MDLSEVKRFLNKTVKYKGADYILIGCMLRKNEYGFYYQLELKDVNANSLVICKMGDVEIE